MFDLDRPFTAKDIIPVVPGLLKLLQDMSTYNPSGRISATVALNRLKGLRSQIPDQELSQIRKINNYDYELIPRSFWRTFFEIISSGQLWIACRYAWISFQSLWAVSLLSHVSSFKTFQGSLSVLRRQIEDWRILSFVTLLYQLCQTL